MHIERSEGQPRARPKRSTVLCVGTLAVAVGLFFPTLLIAVFEALFALGCLQHRGSYRRLFLVAGIVICLLSAVQFVICFTGLKPSSVWTLFMG